MKLGFSAWLFLGVSIILTAFFNKSGTGQWTFIISLPAFIIFFIIVLRMQFGGIKCPECGVNLFGLCWYVDPKSFRFAL